MKKRFLSILLTLVMVLGLFPVTTFTASAATANTIWVGGVEMADGDYLANNAASTTTDKPSGGYAYYENGTLTLHNYSYHGNGYNDDGFYAIIYSEGKLIVKLEGTNSLTNEVLDDSVAMGFDVSDAYFSGTGSLDISGVSYGIYAKTDLTIASGSINVDANNYGLFASKNIYITGGTTTVTSDDYGLYSENIEICGGVVSVTAYNIGIRAYYVDISGGTVTVTANNYYGVCADYSVEISGGSLTAKSNGYAVDTDSFYCTNEEMKAFLGYYFDGSNAEEYDAYYLDEEDIGSYNYVFIASNDSDSESTYSIYVGGIGMNNGEYLEEGAETATTEKPIDNYAYYRDGVLSLYNFEYLGAGYNYADGSYYQIYAPFNLTIELTGKNTLSVPEELTFSYCTGICAKSVVVEENANGSLTISGTTGGVFADNGDIEINGGTIDIDVDGTGIYALNNISVNGGNLKINADDGGMNCYNNEINITNGTVNITSGGNGIASVYGSVSIEGSNVIIASGRYAIYASTLFSMSNGSLDARCVNPLTEDNDSIYYAICSSNVPEFANNMRVRASADPDDSLGVYDASKRSNYDRIVAKEACAVHDYDDGVVTAPTCEDKGYTTYSCDTCGDFYIVNEVTALGHDYDEGTVTIKPGCETEGVMTYTCKNGCGIDITETIEATGHAYDYSNGIVTTEPGCETEGVKTYTCKNGCGIPKTEAIEALEHTWDEGEIIHPATVDKEGEKRYTCLVCGDTKTETIPKLVLQSKAISYDGNGALSGEHETEYILETYTYTLPECNFTPQPGQIFRCWRVKGVDMQPGESFVVETDTVITAIWRDMTVFVGGVEMDDGYYLATGSSTPTTTKPSGGYAFYDDGKLVLNNYTYTGFGVQFSGINHAAIFSAKTLDIELIGTNTLTLNQDDDHLPIGIVLRDDNSSMEIRGEGALSITGGGTAIEARKGGTITVHSGTITTDCDGTGIKSDMTDFVMNGGNVTLVSKQATGMMAGSITVNSGTLDVTGAPYGQGIASQNGDIIINGGKVIVRCNDGDGNDDENYALRVANAGKLVIADKMNVQASTQYDGTLGDFVEADYKTYDRVVIEEAIIRTVTFMVDSTVYKTEKVKDKTLVAQPADPALEGKTFLGWYTEDNQPYNFNLYVEGDIVLYAKFEDNVSIDLTLSANDIKVEVKNLTGSATLIVAQYEGGKMVDVQTKAVSADGTYTMDQLTYKTGCTYKAMLVNSTTYAPLCAANTF